ncbi:hypothetical protein HYT45_03275 [Candidatus Uhrbacteria bacterium]|nr:hypothetical protein [Candidatus Uhrbacteria bacterium]
MKYVKNTTWEDVFKGWRDREANNPGWVHCATKIKGWPDWESWRRFTAKQIDAEDRKWQIFEFSNPMEEVSQMLIGPYSGWQSRVISKNSTTFQELLEIPEQYEHFSKHEGVISILNGLPFTTEFIGLLREDINKVVCVEGHHRATAMALAGQQKRQIDFNNHKITIALSRLPVKECYLFDELLKRGSSKNTQS